MCTALNLQFLSYDSSYIVIESVLICGGASDRTRKFFCGLCCWVDEVPITQLSYCCF